MIVAVVLIALAALLTTALVLASASVRVLREYERGIVFRLGRITDQRGPGLILLIPAIDRMVRVSLRTVTLRIPAQEVITRDNVPARVTAVAYYRIINPARAVVEIEDVLAATQQIAQTTLRSVLGKADLDSLLSERETLNEQLQQIIDDQTEPWGVKVTVVEIKDVEIPERMQHAIARQAEAERERRAKVINAEGEFQAAARLNDAADVISRNPVTIQLRYLQTLREVSGNQSSTIVLPLTMEAFQPLARAAAAAGGARQGPSQAELDEALASARQALEASNAADPATPRMAELEKGQAAEGVPPSRRAGGTEREEPADEGGERQPSAAEQRREREPGAPGEQRREREPGAPGEQRREREPGAPGEERRTGEPSATPEPARFAREPERPPSV